MSGPLARLVGRSRSPVAGLRPRPASRYERRAPAAGPRPPVLDAGPDDRHAPGEVAEPVPGGEIPVADEEFGAAPASRAVDPVAAPAPQVVSPVAIPKAERPTHAGSDVVAAAAPRPERPVISALDAEPASPVVRQDPPSPGIAAADSDTDTDPGRPATDPRLSVVQDPPEDITVAARLDVPQPALVLHRAPLLRAPEPPPAVPAAEPEVVVEVSIGRLDVRTPPAPTPPRTTPVAVQADHARALENYLRRRAEGELG
ncbi:hypothetical protein ACIBU0_00080 [Streptomyces sp. NPDC049627]|uniref:hypothetical protein n=1 Tax=Streptomyces sp. NPDC049627 TaxID=3365595 RepID=UPI0037A99284